MDQDENISATRQLRQEILLARERVYHFGNPTPLEKLEVPSQNLEIWVKREDRSTIKAYKWRGAANRMAMLSELERARGVVTASAGNHAQGVALAAKKMGIHARVYMPISTPQVKQNSVIQHGAEYVSIHLVGESYDEAMLAAKKDQASTQAVYIHPYDDLYVMAGQGTMADEIVLSGEGPFDAAYLQVGGGGMAAGVSTWLKTYWPEIEIIGVEGELQASMKASIEAGEPTSIQQVDLFCDGTAVSRPGEKSFEICQETLDRMMTVSNSEVTSAIRKLWEGLRCIAEPSGAMGLAAALKDKTEKKRKILVVLCGANVDFRQIGQIAQSAGSFTQNSRTVRIQIPEESGSMLRLLGDCLHDVDIADFQYGITDPKQAWPVFTFSSEHEKNLLALTDRLTSLGYTWEDITGASDINFRAIPLNSNLLSHVLFLRLDFYERHGALRDFLTGRLQGNENLAYFNYRNTGERIGRALVGINFPSKFEREAFLVALASTGEGYRLCKPLDAAAHQRMSISFAETKAK